MVEKKETAKKTTAPKVATTKKTAIVKKTTTVKKAPVVKKTEVVINSSNVGFKAGDVYQALATSGKALTISEIAKSAKLTESEVLLGMGWLFKEGKIKDEGTKVALA